MNRIELDFKFNINFLIIIALLRVKIGFEAQKSFSKQVVACL